MAPSRRPSVRPPARQGAKPTRRARRHPGQASRVLGCDQRGGAANQNEAHLHRGRTCILTLVVLAMAASARSGALTEPAPAERARDQALQAARDHLAGEAETEESTLDGRFRIVNLYRVQLAAELESLGLSDSLRVAHFVRRVYAPFRSFWAGYLGDEEAFASWIRDQWRYGEDSRWRIPLEIDFPELLASTARRLAELTERVPEGSWYLVYGPGWTNMGGLSNGVMLVDFYGTPAENGAESTRFALPHELNHLLTGAAHAADPSRGTLLARVLDEGSAVFVNDLYWGGEAPISQSLGYTEEEWRWARAQEEEIWARLESDLEATEREVIDLYVARSSRLWEEAPGAIGYFVGLRIVQTYVERNGPESWRDIYRLPWAEVIEGSGYPASATRETAGHGVRPRPPAPWSHR